MREIKFRQAIYLDGKFSHWWYWGFIVQGEFISPVIVYRNQRQDTQANSQEFTGLHDKNGVEIYEGDIVKLSAPWNLNIKTAQIIFKPAKFLWHTNTGETYIPDAWEDKEVEVIGNIYENKELLKC